MLEIVVRHESVACWHNPCDKWEQLALEYVRIYWSLHYPVEDAYLDGSLHADAGPNMDFCRMLCFQKIGKRKSSIN